METRGNDGPAGQALNSEINVTPLVDVMLVVLIIFMVVAPLLRQEAMVELPRARHVEAVCADRQRILTVVLTGDGRVSLGQEAMGPENLAGLLHSRHETDPGLQLQVEADRAVSYGEVKRILQASRDAGFQGASLVVREIGVD